MSSDSLRQHAARVGATGDFSVMRDVFGMLRGETPRDPSGADCQLSLWEHIDAVKRRHVHLNVIRVGEDAMSSGAQATAREDIDYAVVRIRRIYHQVSLGVGRVRHYRITAAEAGGADDIGSAEEAEDLWDAWYVDNNGLDVFMVRTISADFIGLSPVDGNCNKSNSKSGLLGGQLTGRLREGTARTFAHEIGHFLGLEHPHDDIDEWSECNALSTAVRNRLMTQTGCALSTQNSTVLTSGEGTTMRKHCSIREGV
jgi:hypothetical protein